MHCFVISQPSLGNFERDDLRIRKKYVSSIESSLGLGSLGDSRTLLESIRKLIETAGDSSGRSLVQTDRRGCSSEFRYASDHRSMIARAMLLTGPICIPKPARSCNFTRIREKRNTRKLDGRANESLHRGGRDLDVAAINRSFDRCHVRFSHARTCARTEVTGSRSIQSQPRSMRQSGQRK